MFNKLRQYFLGTKFTPPQRAYRLWASQYDHQPWNLMFALDESIFLTLLEGIEMTNKKVLDIGCGTGRHWQLLLKSSPAEMTGYDISEEMLEVLKNKFPYAVTHQLNDNRLVQSANESVELIISTLTIAHIENIKEALQEWNRVLHAGGHVILTDFHPVALETGATRSFQHQSGQVTIKNHIHSLEMIEGIARELGWELQHLIEEKVDEKSRYFYEQQNAMDVYAVFAGTPMIYGMKFIKQDVN